MQPRLSPVAEAVQKAIKEMKPVVQKSEPKVLKPESKSGFSFLRFWE